MTFQFLFNGTPLEANEAAVLVKSINSGRTKPTIELSDVFDMSSVDSKALFDMAVDKGSHELASLAWKISVAKPARKPHAVRRGRPAAAPSVWEGPEALIEELHKSQSYWSIGAAMLMTYLGDSDDWSTLRKIGVHFVNNLGSSELGTARMPDNSVLYKGFTWNDEKMEFEPLDYRAGIDRKQTFHVSPMYLALREGLGWCGRHGLVEQKSQISYGSKDQDQDSATMRRVYYSVRLTKRGHDVIKLWADSRAYIESYFMKRRMDY